MRSLSSLAFAGFFLLTGNALSQTSGIAAPAAPASGARLIAAVPMAFEENDGQLASGLSFLGRARSYSVAIERDRLRFLLPGSSASANVDVHFAGSRGGSPVSLSSVAYRSNYLIGSDPSRWHEGVPNFSRVGIRGVYPGIDTEFYEKNGELEHDFIVAPGTDAARIRLDLKSAHAVTLAAGGDAVIPTSGGELRFRKPVAYQFDARGTRVPVDAAYRVAGKSLRFALGSYDHSRTLVIDPVIVFATYVSGVSGSTPAQMATDGNGTIFLAGSTPSTTGFPGSTTPPTNQGGAGISNAFVAALTTSKLGTVLDWITFLGNAGASNATSIAYSSNGSGTLYLGGTTTATAFPGVADGAFNGTFPSTEFGNSSLGFVTTLAASTGANPNSTYIATGVGVAAPDTTTVTGLAADSSGNVYISGYGLGVSLPVTGQLGPASGQSSIVPAVAGTSTNAFVIELDAALKTGLLVTYLQSNTGGPISAPSTPVDYKTTAIQIDGSSPANIYVAGTIGGQASIQFPTAESFTAAGVYDETKDFTPCQRNAANTSVFLAQIQPPKASATNSVLGFSMFTCADTSSGSETAQGLALGENGLYLVGDTLSPDLAAGIHYSLPGERPATVTLTGGLQTAFATGNMNGYAIQVPVASGIAAPAAFTFLGGTSANGNTTVHAVATDATNNLVQLAGQTAAKRSTMPGFGVPGLPPGAPQDPSLDTPRAFVYTFDDSGSSPAPLTEAGLKSISYLGNTGTGSSAVSIVPDTTGAGAFVLVGETDGASAFSFTSSSAAGAAAPSQSNTYLADIQGTNVTAATPKLSFARTADSPIVNGTSCSQQLACEITYNGASDVSTIQYKWQLNAPNAPAHDVVLNFPAQIALASAGSPAYTIELDAQTIPCVSRPSDNGTTCTVPSPLTGTHTLTLQGTASANAPNLIGTPQATFVFDGTAADAEGEQADGPQPSVTVAAPVSITTTLTQSPLPPATLDAASSRSDTGSSGHVTVITYTATVENTSANDSKYTTLKMTLPPAFQLTTPASVSGGLTPNCDLTGGTGCTSVDLPAGAKLTYSFSGVYLGSALSSANLDGTFTETVTADGSALPQSTNSKSSANTQTTVRGYAALVLTTTSDKQTYNLSSTTVPDTVTYTIALKNNGPNESGPIAAAALTNTVPQYFHVSSSSVTPANAGTCDAVNGTGCTTLNPIASGSTVTYTVVGNFPDNGTTSTDAVPVTAPNAQATDTAQFSSPTTTFNPNSPTPQNVTVTVQRKADLTLTGAVAVSNNPAPVVPCDQAAGTSLCVYMANDGGPNGASGNGVNDKTQYTVTLQNAGPNIATTASLAIPLPTNFLVAGDPTVSAPPIAVTVTPSAGLTCPTPTILGQTLTCTGYIPVGPNTVVFTSKFAKNAVPSGQKTVTTNPAAQSVTIGAAAVGLKNPSQLPNVTVERAVHLVTLKYVCRSAGITNPAQPCPAAPGTVNLDEKVASDAPGKNDLVQTQIQIGNTQLNDAYGVTVTDPLPSYFTLTQMPDPTVANCKLVGTTTPDAYGNPVTGTTPVTLSCTLINAIPFGTATPGTSTTVHGTVVANTAYAQLTYYGKFADNGLNADVVPQNASTTSVAFLTAQSSSTLAALADTVGDATSPVPPALTVQRAAHLRITQQPQFVQTNDGALAPTGGVVGPGIAEAQPGANGGGAVINPLRYKVTITNDGPNIATNPLVTITLPPNANGRATTFTVQAQSLEPALQGFPASTTCASGSSCLNGGAINPGAPVAFNLDGFFDLATLTEGNSGARIFSSAVASSTIVDSNPAGTTNGDGQMTPVSITVVNTPVGGNFTLAPFDGNLAQPLGLKVTSVQIAGITSLVASGMPALPSGPSPNPPDNGATKPLYKFASGGTYYTLGTTANVPTANSNPTTICLNSIPGTFQKPERVLLWALGNAPAGTAFGAVPHYTGNGSTGDITTLVLAQQGTYSVPVANTTYPPPPAQPQPAQVCGVLNGLADAGTPTTLAVLEPVNFAPYVRTAVTAANASNSQPGKGVTAAAAQVDLTISPQNNYDYNDQDPCFTGSEGTTRSTCNDNVQVTTFLFGGGNLIGETQQLQTYFFNDLQATPKPQFNLPAGQPQLYVVLADQLGAQGYPETTSGGNTQVCDPGNPSSTYTPTTPACPLPNPLPAGIAVPPAQTTLNNTSVEVALLTGNVGFGGSSGLIALPQTATPEAVARVTAGQTAGFVWNWLTEQPQVQGPGGGTPPVLTLACVSADGTNLASVGIQCNIPPTYTYSTDAGIITAPPAIYVVTTGNTAVGALREAPLNRDLQIVAAVVFPVGAIPLVFLFRRRRALKLSGWLAVLLFASLVGLSIGCGSSNFRNMGGTTSTATPPGTYQFIVTATGTDGSGNPINIKSYPFAVTVSAVH